MLSFWNKLRLSCTTTYCHMQPCVNLPTGASLSAHYYTARMPARLGLTTRIVTCDLNALIPIDITCFVKRPAFLHANPVRCGKVCGTSKGPKELLVNPVDWAVLEGFYQAACLTCFWTSKCQYHALVWKDRSDFSVMINELIDATDARNSRELLFQCNPCFCLFSLFSQTIGGWCEWPLHFKMGAADVW